MSRDGAIIFGDLIEEQAATNGAPSISPPRRSSDARPSEAFCRDPERAAAEAKVAEWRAALIRTRRGAPAGLAAPHPATRVPWALEEAVKRAPTAKMVGTSRSGTRRTSLRRLTRLVARPAGGSRRPAAY
jgi:hypothetical protein